MRPTLLGLLADPRGVDGTWDRSGRPATSGYAVTWREFTSLLIPDDVLGVLGHVELRSLVGEWGDNFPNEVEHFGRWRDTDRLVLSPVSVWQAQTRAISHSRHEGQRYFYDLSAGEVCEVPE